MNSPKDNAQLQSFREYQKILESLIRTLPGFIYRCKNDKDWTMIYVSDQCYELTGYRADEFINNRVISFNDIIFDDYRDYLYTKWQEVLNNKDMLREEYKIIRKNGESRWIVEYGRGVFDDDGELLYLDGYIADISSIKETERYLLKRTKELESAKERAEDSDRLKSAFLANLSHEIRTPMNAILGFTQILKDETLSDEQRGYFLDIIFNSGCHLLSIINDIIEISKIETRQIVPNYSSFDLDLLMRNIFEETKVVLSPDKKVALQYENCNDRKEMYILCDPVKLKQIITNLITNAIKFTDHGYIKFGYSVDGEISFFVEDTGVGIDPKYHDLIFERYRQIDKAEGKRGGSGLGLAISKAYVEMLGGKISVESSVGKGSKFVFSVPFVAADSQIKQGTASLNEKRFEYDSNHTLLVAEDDDTNFLYISTLLTKSKNNIIRACNGQEAIDIVSKYKNINLVLMDIKMPIMNGYDALKMIREISPDLPVVAQTAYALPEDEKSIRQAGFDGYITKPIIKEQLIDIINKLIRR